MPIIHFDPPEKTRSEINQYAYDDNSDLLEYVMVKLYPRAKSQGLYGQEDEDNDTALLGDDDTDDDADGTVQQALQEIDPAATTTTTTTTTSSTSPADDKLSQEYIDDAELNDPLSFNRYYSDRAAATPRVDFINKGAGYVNDLLGLSSIGTTTMNFRELYPGKDENGNQLTTDDIKNQQADARRWFSGISFLSSGIGMAQNFMSLYSDTQKMKHSKNQRKRKLAENNNLKNSLGLMTNIFKSINSGIGLFGDPTAADQKNAMSVFSALTDVSNLFTAFAGLKAGIDDRNNRKQILKNISELSLPKDNDTSGKAEARSRALLHSISDKNSSAYKAAKIRHNALKSKKYALQEAAELHEIKKGQAPKGIIGASVSTFTAGVNLAGYIPGLKDSMAYKFVKALNPVVATAGGYAAKYGERKMDNDTNKAIKERQKSIIYRYITDKSRKIQKQADHAFKNHPQANAFKNLTQNEKERIVVARMGVHVEISQQALDEYDLMSAYEIRNKKQAKAIMNSGKKNREEILKALMLDNDATLEDIQSALKGD